MSDLRPETQLHSPVELGRCGQIQSLTRSEPKGLAPLSDREFNLVAGSDYARISP